MVNLLEKRHRDPSSNLEKTTFHIELISLGMVYFR